MEVRGNRFQVGGRRRRRVSYALAAAGLAAVLVTGVSYADRGHGGNHDHARRGPVDQLGPAKDRARAGQLQHAPTNLGKLKRPHGRGSLATPAPSTRKLRPFSSGPRFNAAASLAAIPPSPVITAKPTNPSTSRNASFSFTDTVTTATFRCRLDSAPTWTACTSPKSYTGLSYASHVFRVVAVNASGSSAGTSFGWTIQVAPPTITAKPVNPTTVKSASFSFTDTDATVTYQCSLDSAAYAACTNPKSYAGPLSVASHTFRVRALSGLNVSAATSYTWAITAIATPPAPAITSSPTNPTTATTASFSFTDTDATATFQCSLDGSAFAACASPASYSALTLTTHTFQVRGVNLGGAGAATTFTWLVTPPPPPTPTITATPANPTIATSATFSFADTDAFATFQCSLDAAAFTTCTSPLTYATVTAAAHTFQVRAVNPGGASSAASFTWTVSANRPVKMRLLVISADGKETDLPAIQNYLNEIGVPYDTLTATTAPAVTASTFSDGTTGKYQGVILTTGNLTYDSGGGNWVSAFTPDEWTALWTYEAQYKVRQVTSYTFPYGAPDDYGLNLATYQDTLATPLAANLTAAGAGVFSYLNTSSPITFSGAWAYLATQRDASVTPLITANVGGTTYVLASTDTYADGRQNLAVTVANNPFLLHTKLLSYGLVNWVTKGLFLGSRHVTSDVQVDDLLIDSNLWDTVNNTDHDADPQNGTQYRLDATDWQNIINWQNSVHGQSSLLSNFKLEFAFNGEGAFGDPSGTPASCSPIYPDLTLHPPITSDTLTPAVKANPGNFNYLNHTYDHQNVNLTDYATSAQQIQWNQQAASATGLGGTCPAGLNLGPTFDPSGVVQPDISGLTNANFLQAAYDNGIRYLITDTSAVGWNNPSPNVGFKVGPNGAILAVPRHPTNLFYSLQTQAQWVSEYNWFYWTGSPSTSAWKIWPTQQTYAQIVDLESSNLLAYLLNWDSDPWMFHQANLGRYDAAGHSLLSDLLNATFTKYLAAYNLPIVNLSEKQAGQVMANRMAYNASGADATLWPCVSMSLSVTSAAPVPITGATAGTTESYGGQAISTVQATPGTTTTIPVSCS